MQTREAAADLNCALLRMSVILRPFAAHCLAGELIFDRTNCGSVRDISHVRSIKTEAKNGVWKLRLILDGECAELFVGDGEHVLSALIDTPADVQGITFCSDGELTVDIEKHTLG